MQVIDEVLAHLPDGIVQETARFLALHVGDALAPGLEAGQVALIGQAHEFDEALTELVELAARFHHALGHVDVAGSRGGQRQCLLHVHAVAVNKILRHHRGRWFAQLDALASRQDGAQDALLVVAHKDEFAVVVGFLDEL